VVQLPGCVVCIDLMVAASIGIALGAVTGALMMVALLVIRRKYVVSRHFDTVKFVSLRKFN